jgi:hypothetical protein
MLEIFCEKFLKFVSFIIECNLLIYSPSISVIIIC